MTKQKNDFPSIIVIFNLYICATKGVSCDYSSINFKRYPKE